MPIPQEVWGILPVFIFRENDQDFRVYLKSPDVRSIRPLNPPILGDFETALD
jgi:hypothetical protein